MLATLAAIAAVATHQQQQQLVMSVPVENNPRLTIQMVVSRLDPPKLSPKLFDDQRWEFDWMVRGYGALGDDGTGQLRLRLYSQERKEPNIDKAPKVARMVMQIWDRCFRRLKLDTPERANHSIVDIYLCFGGSPGGEQLFGQEFSGTSPQATKVNTIYIYQLSSFKDPVEMAREVAHEYGHAILPPIGGFRQPEAYANGYLGEKMFLRWMRDGMASKTFTSDDCVGATLDSLNAWVAKNVDPLVVNAATQYPDVTLITDAKGGMDAFMGLALYAEQICPPAIFLKSLLYTQSAHNGTTDTRPPSDYPEQLLTAVSEVESVAFAVPPSMLAKKQNMWIPIGKGTVSGASVVSKKGGWAYVTPLQSTILLKNPPL